MKSDSGELGHATGLGLEIVVYKLHSHKCHLILGIVDSIGHILMRWRRLGAGSYNTSYRSEDGTLVFKVSHDASPTDLPERSVRLWNLLNAHIQPPAKISRQKINDKWVTGWICPYIEGRQATDQETRDELLNIFNRTGRIITDATAPNNFLRARNGQIICIDIGHALEMEKRETAALVGLTRKPSLTSLEAWSEHYDHQSGRSWINNAQLAFPKAINAIKALLFIKNHRPDITNVSFLQKSSKTIQLLAQAYDSGAEPFLSQALNLLIEKRNPDLENTKQKCRGFFLEYLLSRGTIDKHEQFIPHSPHSIDVPHLQHAMALMRQINTAQSCDECHAIIRSYVALLPPTEIEEHVVPIKTIRSPEVTDLMSELEMMVEEVKGVKELVALKDKCRIILEGYIMVYGGQFLGEELTKERDVNPSQTIMGYKSQLATSRMDHQVEVLIQSIDSVNSFEELLYCFDGFIQESPQFSSTPEAGSSLEGLISSVNICRLMVVGAINALQHDPLLSKKRL